MAPVPKPNDQRKSLANPSGGNPRHTYSVRIGRREPIELDYESVHWVEGLDLQPKHDVVIYADGVPLESWSFRFSDYTFKNRGKPDLCLFLEPLYLSWQLWRVERTEDWCPCWSREAGLGNSRYPNELQGFVLWETGAWRDLQPLVSTLDDVRRVLGPPERAVDLRQYSKPYPGDGAAQSPVFTYFVDDDYDILVYFVRSDYAARRRYPAELFDRLLSIDFVPKRQVSFRGQIFPRAFSKERVRAADAAWDDHSDGSGLVYSVYSAAPAHGDAQQGDLNRISYGPPE
ncbi:hypothetical protein ABI59_10190 [Acidobacteria bacterium Mor1]|nr:hypothetical protein ABI59_10190 [Acidobacteria bacterium Mor1]